MFGASKTIVMKKGNEMAKQIAAIEAMREVASSEVNRRIENDLRQLRAGEAGESRVMFELENSHLDMVILQDLYLEYGGLTAQIDFLVLTRQRNFVIECKNLYGNIRVNERGDFVRTFNGGKEEGFYSPITQNQRHIDLIHDLKRCDRNLLANLMLDGEFSDRYRSLVVLANPKTILDDSLADNEVRRKIVRVDQLVSSIRKMNEESGPGRDKKAWSTVVSDGEWFLSKHADRDIDYAARYRPMSVPVELPQDAASAREIQEGQNSAEETEMCCPLCGSKMILRVAKKGKRAGQKFYGCSNYPKCRGIVNT